ncbi:MAG: N-6 DNA methylase [Candidatus Kapabacteria bacterium]|nr:N-6 DNA methylase [Candidatus Kapabacteria bacterium]
MKELIEQFSNNIEDYKSTRYDEENTKIDFIDKFFLELGWDVYNSTGASEDFREVIREDKVVIEGKPKSPDYCFKIGRERQFFVEAKKPSINIFFDSKSAFQLRRYGYTAGLSISILTNFNEFSIYDTSIKPKESDGASIARIFYCKYSDFENNWEFFSNTISKQAVWQGKFKKFKEDNTKKKVTQTIDKELLDLIEGWRIELAKNIALRNKELDTYFLNEAVQTIIDRIIFLRMAEDRNTEKYASLQIFSKNKDIYDLLIKYFDSSNKKYNSGLFKTVNWINDIKVDDKILKGIINDLYYPMPYEFSVLPIEVLGQIYEQFLGKTITLSNRHVAKVEEKPEVRKAGGVYYTPQYIVDFIIEKTIGRRVKNKSPKDIEDLTILDPACGSGSFLVGAYKYLLNFHIEFYLNNGNIKKALKEAKIYQAGKDDYRLTIREKKKILLNNIYGVDIDKQAVEVTKLSLLLTLMEGEITESKGEIFLKSISEALLPDLDDNIKCGNSLIGIDFYLDKNLEMFDRQEQRKINCFDWEDEFKRIMKSGGFDVVIGNPPWVFTKYVSWGVDSKDYISQNYLSDRTIDGKSNSRQAGKINLFAIFILRATTLLNKNGTFGFIIPNNILRATVYDSIRRRILGNCSIKIIVNLKPGVFVNVTASPVILITDNNYSSDNKIDIIQNTNKEEISLDSDYQIDQKSCLNNQSFVIDILLNDENKDVVSKVNNNSLPLERFLKISNGIATLKNKEGISQIKENENFKPLLFGKDISRFYVSYKNKYINYEKSKLHRARNESIFLSKEKLIMQRIGGILITTYDNKQFYTFNSVNNFTIYDDSKYNIKYFLGILNSKLLRYYYISKFTNNSSLTVNISKTFLRVLPIKPIEFSIKSQKSKHDKMVSLVEQMLEAQIEAHSDKLKSDTDKKLINQRINVLDKQIDSLVYDLYELTEEEIIIIEQEYK